MNTLKRCSKCHQELPATAEHFHRNRTKPDGLYDLCKPCNNARNRNYLADARERFFQRQAMPIDKTTNKQCSICKEILPATTEHFYRRKESPDGLRADCRKCLEERNRKWQEANPDRVRANARGRTARHRDRNKEAVYQRTREWKAKNPDNARNYRAANRPAFALYSRTRKDRVAGLPHSLTKQQWQFALDYFDGCCAVCGRSLYGILHVPSIDHWIPISAPNCPGSVAGNSIPLCHGIRGCNSSKNDRDPEEWLVATYGPKRARVILAKIQAYFALVS